MVIFISHPMTKWLKIRLSYQCFFCVLQPTYFFENHCHHFPPLAASFLLQYKTPPPTTTYFANLFWIYTIVNTLETTFNVFLSKSVDFCKYMLVFMAATVTSWLGKSWISSPLCETHEWDNTEWACKHFIKLLLVMIMTHSFFVTGCSKRLTFASSFIHTGGGQLLAQPQLLWDRLTVNKWFTESPCWLK